jgi:hypothetical protein
MNGLKVLSEFSSSVLKDFYSCPLAFTMHLRGHRAEPAGVAAGRYCTRDKAPILRARHVYLVQTFS